MEIKALGEMVFIRVDEPDALPRREDGVQSPTESWRRCQGPSSTGIIVSLGDGFEMDRSELPVEDRYRSAFRFPKVKIGDHVVFSRHALSTQTIEFIDEGVEYIALPGMAILGVLE